MSRIVATVRTQARFVLLFVGLIYNNALLAADDDNAQKTDLIMTSVMRDLGVFDLVRDVSQILLDGLNQRQLESTAQNSAEARKLERAAQDLFSEAAIAERIRANLRKSYDPSRYLTIQRLLQSSAGKRLVQARRAAFAPSASAEIKKIASEHDEKASDKVRIELMTKLDDLSADTELFVAVQALSIHALSRMVTAQESPGTKITESEQEVMLQRSYNQLLRPSRFTTAMTYQYAFRAHSNDEIQQFIDIYDFTDVHWFIAQLMDSLRAAMEQATREAETRLAPSK